MTIPTDEVPANIVQIRHSDEPTEVPTKIVPLDEEGFEVLVSRMEKELILSMPHLHYDHPLFNALETAVGALGDVRALIQRRRGNLS
jgi:hypothetical protein